MSISIYSNSNKISYGVKHYNLRQVEDLLKIDTKSLATGSTAFIMNTSKHYMLNSKKMWIEITPAGGTQPSEEEYIYNGGLIDDEGELLYDGGSIDD